MDYSNAHFNGDRPASECFTVTPDDVCPDCGEDRIDWLAWDDDGEYVTCASCSCVYVP